MGSVLAPVFLCVQWCFLQVWKCFWWSNGLKRITASWDFHEGSKTSGCVEKYFFLDNLGEIFAHKRKQGIFNACVTFGTFWEDGVRRGEYILVLSRIKVSLQDLCMCWMLKGKSILVLLGLGIKAFLSHFDILNIKTWCKTELGCDTSSHMGFSFPCHSIIDSSCPGQPIQKGRDGGYKNIFVALMWMPHVKKNYIYRITFHFRIVMTIKKRNSRPRNT